MGEENTANRITKRNGVQNESFRVNSGRQKWGLAGKMKTVYVSSPL